MICYLNRFEILGLESQAVPTTWMSQSRTTGHKSLGQIIQSGIKIFWTVPRLTALGLESLERKSLGLYDTLDLF